MSEDIIWEKKWLKDLLNIFVDTIIDNEDFNELSKPAEDFLDEYVQIKKEQNLGFVVNSKNFTSVFDYSYNDILNYLFTSKIGGINFIRDFSSDMLEQFCYLADSYLRQKSNESECPIEIKQVLLMFSTRITHDQIICKYDESRVENLSLEIDRMSVTLEDISSTYETLKCDSEVLKKNSEDLKKNSEDLKKDYNDNVKKMKKQSIAFFSKIDQSEKRMHESSITILGIFAAIVLVFNASVSFYSTIIEAFSTSSIYRVTMVLLLIGLIVSGVMMGLFYYLETVRNSSSISKKMLRKKDGSLKCSSLKPFVILISILITLILLVTISWWIDIVQYRNEQTNKRAEENKCNVETSENLVVSDKTEYIVEGSTCKS